MSKILGYKPIIYIVLVSVLISTSACGSRNSENLVDTAAGSIEIVKIDQKAQPAEPSAQTAVEELEWVTTDSGLNFVSLIDGDGPKPLNGHLVKVQYTGKLANGSIFNSSVGRNPYIFTLGQGEVIPGWDEGIALMNVGSKAMLFVPPELAYDDIGAQYVPPNSLLVFDVELLAILQGSPASPTEFNEADIEQTASGLKIADIEQGNGPSPEEDYLVTVHYTGWFADGTKFDSSLDRDTPYAFRLGQEQVIPGWEEGIETMQVGGTRQLVVPPALAYGEDGVDDFIPSDETLTFEVELLSILRGAPASPTAVDDADLIETDSGLKFTDFEFGDSTEPDDGSIISVHYTGWLSDGTKFDSSLDRGTPFVFTLGQREVILGWEEGIRSMGIGGKRQLTIPPALAYGGGGYGALIPPDSTLVFEVEVVDIQ